MNLLWASLSRRFGWIRRTSLVDWMSLYRLSFSVVCTALVHVFGSTQRKEKHTHFSITRESKNVRKHARFSNLTGKQPMGWRACYSTAKWNQSSGKVTNAWFDQLWRQSFLRLLARLAKSAAIDPCAVRKTFSKFRRFTIFDEQNSGRT